MEWHQCDDMQIIRWNGTNVMCFNMQIIRWNGTNVLNVLRWNGTNVHSYAFVESMNPTIIRKAYIPLIFPDKIL
jgi:hypothetical protein